MAMGLFSAPFLLHAFLIRPLFADRAVSQSMFCVAGDRAPCHDHGVCAKSPHPGFDDPIFNVCDCDACWGGPGCTQHSCTYADDIQPMVFVFLGILLCGIGCVVALCCLCGTGVAAGAAGLSRRHPSPVKPHVPVITVTPPNIPVPHAQPPVPHWQQQTNAGDVTPNPNIEDESKFPVLVPEGCGPGSQIYVMSPTGLQVMVTVPEGFHSGQTFFAQV